MKSVSVRTSGKKEVCARVVGGRERSRASDQTQKSQIRNLKFTSNYGAGRESIYRRNVRHLSIESGNGFPSRPMAPEDGDGVDPAVFAVPAEDDLVVECIRLRQATAIPQQQEEEESNKVEIKI